MSLRKFWLSHAFPIAGLVVAGTLAVLAIVLTDEGAVPVPPEVRVAQAIAAHSVRLRPVRPPTPVPKPAPAIPEQELEPDEGAAMFAAERGMTTAQRVARFKPFIVEASNRYKIPQTWIRAVMIAESAGRTMSNARSRIISSAGAMGLMQLMPGTWADMRRAHGLGNDPYDPHDNIIAGTAYLHDLHAKYGYPQMFAAYNDGPGHLDQRIANARLLPTETIVYVERVTATVEGRRPGAGGFVRFTRPDGSPVFFDGGAVRSVRAALPGEYAESVRSVITVGGVQQGVRESVGAARSIIVVRGGAVGTKMRTVRRLVLACAREEPTAGVGRIKCSRGPL